MTNRIKKYNIAAWLKTLVKMEVITKEYADVQSKLVRVKIRRGETPWNDVSSDNEYKEP